MEGVYAGNAGAITRPAFVAYRPSLVKTVLVNSQNNEIKPNLYPQFENSYTKDCTPLRIELENQKLGLEIDWKTAVTKWTGDKLAG